MKKRVLTLLLAVMMVCTLLPFSSMAADLSPYTSLITDVASPSSEGVLKDLDGDGVEELFMIWDNGDGPFGQIFTLENGKPKKLIELTFTGPDITETNEYADLAIISAGKGGLVVKTQEAYTDYGLLENTPCYWNEGGMVFYELKNGELKQTDSLRYKLLMEDRTDRVYTDYCTVTLNDKPITVERMNEICLRAAQVLVPTYPMTQVYNATKGFFQDVAEDAYYAPSVGWALNFGVTNGTSNVDFSPNAGCTRGQVVTFLWRAAGKPAPKSGDNPFRDVKAGQYYTDAVLWAVEEGITTGTSATTFSPDEVCTRCQVVTFLWRYYGKPAVSTSNPFTDVARGQYYYDAVLWAVNRHVTTGETAATFGPDNTCTRGQIVTFLHRAIK